MKRYCTHHECRVDTSTELAWMAETLCRPKLLVQAVAVFNEEVRCRQVPRMRNNAMVIPLPEKK